MKHFVKILILLTICSCANEKKNEDSKFSDINKQFNSKEISEPLFLDLSPKMSDIIFDQKLKNSLPSKKFEIPINEYKFEFSIEKLSNRIILKYDDITTLIFTPKYGDNSEKRFSNFIKTDYRENAIIDSFKRIFENNYSNKIDQLPLYKNQLGEYFNNKIYSKSNRTLERYGFNQENYMIFQDSMKTVLIGYTNADLPRKLDSGHLKSITYRKQQSEKNSTFRKSIRTQSLYDLVVEHENELNKLSPYERAIRTTQLDEPITRKKGISLEINYMTNSDFNLLSDKIHLANKNYNNGLRREDSLLILKKIEYNKNLNDL